VARHSGVRIVKKVRKHHGHAAAEAFRVKQPIVTTQGFGGLHRWGRVSVLMPAYKTPGLVVQAVQSCLDQELPEGWSLEVLVGIDACPKTLAAVLALKDDPRVRIVEFEHNTGPYKVLNGLFKLSSGEVIAILDSDDLMQSKRLKKQLHALRGADFVGSLYNLIPAKKRGKACVEHVTLNNLGFAIHSTWCVKRTVYQVLGGYRGWRCGADTDFYIRALAQGAKMRVLQEPLSIRRVRPNQLTSPGTATGPGSPARLQAQQNVSRDLAHFQRGGRPGRAGFEANVVKKVHSGRPRLAVVIPTLPTRQRSAKFVVTNFLRQGADLVILHLNGHGAVPEWVKNPKIKAILNPKGTGPMSRWSEIPDADFVLSADDDLRYPKDYVERTLDHLLRLGRSRMISYHCSHWPPGATQLEERIILGFSEENRSYTPKTYMGSGVAAFFGDDLRQVERKAPKLFQRLDDVWMSAAVSRAGIHIYRPPSPKAWIGVFQEQENGIYSWEIREKFRTRKAAIAAAQNLGGWSLTPKHPPLGVVP
jgi:hypothetical protein